MAWHLIAPRVMCSEDKSSNADKRVDSVKKSRSPKGVLHPKTTSPYFYAEGLGLFIREDSSSQETKAEHGSFLT